MSSLTTVTSLIKQIEAAGYSVSWHTYNDPESAQAIVRLHNPANNAVVSETRAPNIEDALTEIVESELPELAAAREAAQAEEVQAKSRKSK